MSFAEWSNKKKKEQEQNGYLGTTGVQTSPSGKSNTSSFAEWSNSKVASGVDKNYIDSFFTDANNFLTTAEEDYGKVNWGNAYDFYTSRSTASADLKHRSYVIRTWLDNNKDKLEEETYNSFRSALDEFDKSAFTVIDSFKRTSDYYGQWDSEDSYRKDQIDWLEEDAELNDEAVAARKAQYQSNQDRLSQINKDMPWYGNSWLPNFVEDWFMSGDQVALRNEYERLQAENTRYEREQKRLDDHYMPVTPEFEQGSANRNFTNATKQELWRHDAAFADVSKYLGDGIHYLDEHGNVINSTTQKVVYSADEYSKAILENNSDAFYNAVVQDKLGMYLALTDEEIGEAYSTVMGRNENDTWANLIIDGENNAWKQLTDHEIKTYYYYLNTQGQAAAYQYLEDLTIVLTKRATQARADEIANAGVLEQIALNIASIPMNVLGGAIGAVGDVANAMEGKEYNPYSAAHSWTNDATAIRQDTASDINNATGNASLPWVGTTWGDVYQSLMSGADSTVGVAVGGNAYGVLMGMGAASSEMKELYERGATEEQIIAGGLLAGAAEMVFEKYSIDSLVKIGDTKTIKAMVINALKQGGVEASEEVFTEIATTITDYIVMGSETDWVDLETFARNVVNAGIGGFISGGTMGGIYSAFQKADYDQQMTKQGEELLAKNATDPLRQLALEMSAEKKGLNAKSIGKLANKVTDVATDKNARNVGRLSDLMADTITEQNLSEIKTALKEKGFSRKDINRISAYIQRAQQGELFAETEEATAKIENEVVKNEKISDVLAELVWDSNSALNTRTRNLLAAQMGEYNPSKGGETATEGAEASETPTDTPTEKETAVEPKFKVSADGKAKLGDTEVKIKEIASINDGKVTLRLEDDSTVDAVDVEFGSNEEGLLYENVVSLGLNATTANAFINGYDGKISVAEYAGGFRQAYRYGELGIPKSEMKSKNFAPRLTASQKDLAYNHGAINAKYNADKKQSSKAKIASTSAENAEKNASKGKKKGKLHNTLKPTNETQRASLKALGVLAEALGIDIYTFESPVVNGKRVGKNGWYNPETRELGIDLYAGADGKGTMLFTAAHELTHHIREQLPAKFKAFADFLFEQYGEHGVSVSERIAKKIEHLEANGRTEGKTEAEIYDLAYEEVVADSCESFLADGEAVAKIAELKAKDKTLWQTIKDFFTKLVARIKEAYKGLSPDTIEGNKVAEMLDVVEQLKAMWTEMVVEASEVQSTAEQTLSENGIAVDPSTDSAVLMSVRDLLDSKEQQKVAKALASRFGVTIKEAEQWISAETSLASLILNPKYSQYLDYTPDPNEVAIKQNSDYPQGTVDFSPICAKRREFTSVMNNILRLFPNHVFAATDLAKIRSIMQEEGMTIPCGICYVEDRRQLDTIVAQNFIDSLKLYREGSKTRPDGKAFNANQLKGLSLTDGDSYTPSVYELVSLEGLNVLKAKNPNMAEAWVKFNNARGMQSVRLLANEAEYKRQILKYTKTTVQSKNDKGGLRVYSFSDAEMFHLIDIIQVITDSATVGLCLQGYTKVNEYARAVKDTGEKLNRSLIPKGELGYHIEDGKVILDYDTVEGIDINHPDFFDNRDNPNVGNITIGVSDVQIRAAMVSDFVDQIIPFHTGQSEEVLGEKGIATWTNYKDFQTEKDIATGKVSEHQINIYTEVLQVLEKEGKPITKRTFVEKFLQVCKENNLTPRFSQFLNTNEKGEYVYTEGYHKMLVDFKTFAQTEVGEYLPQMPVKPIFENEYITKILKDYVKSQKVKDAEIAKSMPRVIERITNEIVKPSETKFSDRASNDEAREFSDADVKYSIREEAPPKHTKEGYKVFVVKNGKLYPPMVANPNAEDTPVGVWLNADIGTRAPDSKTGRAQVKAGGKGTQGGSGSLAFRPGWHLGETPLATQFDRTNPETGVKELFPENFVWALCDIAADHDYQEEAMSYGYNKNGKFQHSLAGLPKLPTDGYYKYRTNPNPDTVPWLITGAMKVKKLLSDAEVNAILAEKGLPPKQRVGGDKTLADLGLSQYEGKRYSDRSSDRDTTYMDAVNRGDMRTAQRMVAEAAKEAGYDSPLLYHGTDRFGFTVVKTTGVEDGVEWSPFFASNKQQTSASYTNYGRVREISQQISEDDYDTAMEDVNRDIDDEIANFRLLIDRTFSEWYFGQQGNGYLRDAFDNAREEAGYGDGVYDVFEEIIADAYYKYGDSLDEAYSDFDEWLEESKEGEKLIGSVQALEGLRTKQAQMDATPIEDLGGLYQLYANTQNLFVLDGNGTNWNNLRSDKLPPISRHGVDNAPYKTRDVAEWARKNGYDGVVFKNIRDSGKYGDAGVSDVYVFFSPESQVKSADPVTYDDNGNVIPLSERFKSENEDIRYSDRVLMGSLFSGGGTLEAGLAYQMLDKEFGVEYDGKIASVYADNHGDHIQVGKVEDFDISKYEDIFYLHASPVCHNFSKAKHGAKELQMDLDSAKATAKHLETAMPQVFTVENAPGYRKSQSLKIITDKLTQLGYKWDVDVYNSADYGSATSRNRVILRAVKDGELPAKPSKQERTNSWDKVTKDLWETLPKSYLRPSFISAIENTPKLPILDANGKVNVNKPLLILTTTSGHTVTYCWEGEICPTLTTKCGEAKLVMPDGNIYAVTPEFMGRIQGLPDDYKYPKAKTRAFTIIGNGIPTHLTKAVVGGVLDSAYEQTHDGQVLYSDRYSEGLSEADKATAKEIISRLEFNARASRYGVRALGTYTEERMEREISYSASETVLDYAKSYIAWVDPNDFIYATTNNEQNREHLREEAGDLDIERLRDQRQPIYLDVDFENGRILGHEGRHRMLALQKAGVDKVAVVIDARNDDRHHTKPIGIMNLDGQDFGSIGKGHGFFLHDMLPLSKRYAEVAKSLFSFEPKGGVRFSDRDNDSVSNRSLLANALESVAQNDIERNKLKEYKSKIALIESEQTKLAELRSKIKELSFAKGERDTKALNKLQFEANQTANRINTYDRQLLNLESTKALKGVLEREKQMAYKRAEKRGKEALKAQREKDRERNAKTQRELLERYQESRKKGIESRHKTEMRYKLKNVVNELNQYLLNGTKEKHVPIELQKAVAEALNAVNMDTVGAEERIAKKREEMRVAAAKGNADKVNQLAKEIEHIQEMGGNLEAKLSRLQTAYDSIINSEDPLIANSHDEVISNSIAKVIEVVGDTPIRDMSLYQLEAVYDMYRMVLTTIRNTNKAFKAAKGEEISTIANGVIAELDEKKRKSPYSTKAMDKLSELDWNNLKPVYAFERIGSANFSKVFNAVRAGEDVWAKDMSEAQAFREEQFKQYKYKSWDFKKRYAFESTSGMRFELSLEQILSLYAFSKRDQAGDHLKYGGFVFDGLTEVKKKNKVGVTVTYQLKDATAYNLSEETLAEIISKLTPEQKAFADAMQDYLSTVMGEKGNEVSLALYDIKLFKEKHYFPLKSAPQYMAKAKEQAQGEVKIKNKGFTKETTPKAKNPIVLSSFMDVWAGHVNEMSMYHAFTLPLEDFYRVYNYHTSADEKMEMMSVGASLENAHGQAAVKYIDQLLKDLNGGARSDPRENIFKIGIANFKKASVLASLSVVVQQPTAIVRSMALVDAKYFVGRKMSKGKHKAKWAEIQKYAPVAVIKDMGYFDTGMGKGSVEWLKGEKTWKDKVDDIVSKAPALADEVTWVAMWNAVKRETLHTHKHLQPNSEAFLQACGERFTEIIVKTQVYDSTLARSANMRSKSTFMNMLTAFMAEPTTSINMLQDAFGKFKSNKKYFARTIGAVYGSVVLNAALVSLVYAMRDDDEDETFLEKYLSRFVTEVVDGINPLTYIPFVKDIWSAAQGFDVERADMSLITEVFDSLQQVIQVLNKDTSDMDAEELDEHYKAVTEAWLSVGDNIASLVGVPLKNVRRDINGVINLFETIGRGNATTAGSLADNIGEDLKDSIPVWGWFPDESKGDKLYDAIINGDTTYVERMEGQYETDTAYASAIRKALRNNDPRIKEAAQANVNGDYDKYNRLLETILAEGHFTKADIKAAVRAEINDMTPDEETSDTSADKEVSFYEMEYVYNEIVEGDIVMAHAMREDIIRTKVANGKTREEAEASFVNSLNSSAKKHYEEGDLTDYEARNILVNFCGKTAEEAESRVRYWDFKQRYPDYDLSESAVSNYYNDVEPSGISVEVYYDYYKQSAKCKGTDNDGDGRADSGTKKAEVMRVINSLPITSYQKDVLYRLNGWSESTLWQAPWH